MRVLVLAWLVVCALVFVARADNDALDTREEARREFTLGQEADKRKDWAKAIEHYLRANDLVSHPFTMFNIATDYERLGRLREAVTWYERYIEATPDENDKAKVAKLVKELALRPGTLTVRSTPNGAQVWIDGGYVGTTPYSGHIKGGRHKVSTRLQGQQPDEKEISIEYGEPVIHQVSLRGAAGTLVVLGSPEGALVTVDGMPAGSMPARLDLTPGVHRITVSQYGYAPFETDATVKAGYSTPVKVVLPKALGSFQGPTTPTAEKLDFGYVIGAGGGGDIKGEGELYMVEIGTRVSQYDASVRVGKALGETAVDFIVRYHLTKGAVAPFLGGGYSYVTGGFGYEAIAGLRFDVSRSPGLGVSIIAESGVRWFSRKVELNDVESSEMGTLVPLMGYLQIVYR
ncbi:MAG TPA: PEGA domain-containing protein [Kofleriaceae bacterium]